jgi:hypothetical protein
VHHAEHRAPHSHIPSLLVSPSSLCTLITIFPLAPDRHFPLLPSYLTAHTSHQPALPACLTSTLTHKKPRHLLVLLVLVGR